MIHPVPVSKYFLTTLHWECVVVILIWSKFFDYSSVRDGVINLGTKRFFASQWWRLQTVINHQRRRRQRWCPPLWSESSVIVILMSIICLKQRRTAEGGGRLWRVQPNIQIISDLIRILLFYKSWTSQDWAGRNSSGSRYGQTPDLTSHMFMRNKIRKQFYKSSEERI